MSTSSAAVVALARSRATGDKGVASGEDVAAGRVVVGEAVDIGVLVIAGTGEGEGARLASSVASTIATVVGDGDA